MLIYVQLQLPCQLHKHKQKINITYLTSWHNSIFGKKKNRLRTIEAKNP